MDRRQVLGLAAAAGVGLEARARAVMAAPAAVSASPDTQAAWQEYLDSLNYARAKLLGHPRCRDEGDRARALYNIQMLQTTGFNFYMAPRRGHPNLYIHSIFMPFEIAWGQPCPDFLYRDSFLSGANTYRLWGKIGTTKWFDVQLMNGFWGDPSSSNIINFEPASYADKDGRFEIILSPDPQPGKNWVQIPRDCRNLFFLSREAWSDWEHDVGVKIQIEPLKIADTEPEWTYTEAETNRRMRESGRWVRANADFSIDMISHIESKAGGRNLFAIEWDKDLRLNGKDQGGNPKALKARMVYDIAPDEALIVELDEPKATFWAYSIGDIWYQTPDYSYHQSSLNGHQTRTDSDGKVRYVMAHQDPGVANWIDLVGQTQGMVNFRFYQPLDNYFPEPLIRLVKARDIGGALPKATPRVSPEARRESLDRRARASLARYGY